MEDSPHSRCKFLVLEQRQIGPHMYKCANDEAVKEAELSQKLEDLWGILIADSASPHTSHERLE